MTKKSLNSGLVHEELDNRLLFSADAEAVLINNDMPETTEPAIVELVSENESEVLQLEQSQQASTDASTAKEVVFIDENVDNFGQLMEDLSQRDDVDIFILNHSVDGVEQISQVLQNYQDLDAVHLVSHGNEAGLMLGNGTLDNGNVDQYREAIAGWQSALSEEADLLIYGCNLAAGAEGQALLNELKDLTGTDIAASDDLTGHSTLSGDWDLEYQAGEIETAIAFSQQIQLDWSGTLMKNNAPEGGDNTVIAMEDTSYTFNIGDFNFSDTDGNNLQAIIITTVPGAGSLTLDGAAVNAGDTISAGDISGGELVFTPANDANGSAYTSFTFQVQDDGGTAMGGSDTDSTPNIMSVDVTAVNDTPTGSVSISGTAAEDQTLTADTSALADADGLGTFSYTWQRDGVDIAGATGSTYTLTDADVGAAITTKVSYTDGDGTLETITSAATATVANVNDAPTGGISISGTATEDQTLTADTSALVDADGLGTFSYTWQRDGVDIAGATASSYTLTDADVGAVITTKVSYTDGQGTVETITSGPTAAVANVNDAPTGGISITGTATEDQTLTADTSALSDADGLGTFSYTWQRDGVDIAGATGSTYTLTDADVGAAITTKVSYTDGQGTVETITSGPTAAVANVNDAATGEITISGNAQQGETLTADASSLADADGLGAFSYTWQRDGVDIAGATGNSYTLTDADVGATITAKVSYTDGQGTAETINSAATATVSATPSEPATSSPTVETVTSDAAAPAYYNEPIVIEVEPLDSEVEIPAMQEMIDEATDHMDEIDIVVDINSANEPRVFIPIQDDTLSNTVKLSTDGLSDRVTYLNSVTSEDGITQSNTAAKPPISPLLAQALDELNLQLEDNAHASQSGDNIIVTTVSGASIILTTAFISWALQSGSLLTPLSKTLPAWNSLDPLALLNSLSNRGAA